MRKCSKCLIVLVLSLPATSQTDLQTQYPILNLQANKLQFYGDTTRFTHFFEQLDRVLFDGEGQVNILHMGGSHVQGGVLTHTMRSYMTRMAPGLKSSRGLIFPFALAETNNPYNYKVVKKGKWEGARSSVDRHKSRWGISGITARTLEADAGVALYARDRRDSFNYTRARIFYHMQEGAYSPVLTHSVPVKVLTDSTAGYTEFQFEKPQDTLELRLEKNDSVQHEFLLQGIQLLSEGPGIVYHPVGVNGASTDDYLRAQDFTRQLRMLPPDLVIFGIGINDANVPESRFSQARFESYYQELINRIRQANPAVAVLFLTNNDSYYKRWYPNKNALAVQKSMINLAKANGAAYWDLFEVMGGLNSIRIWEAYDLARPDKIHFTRRGYELQAELLFSALKEAYGNYLFSAYQQTQP